MLHQVAQSDTPSTVDVPNTTTGLVLWLVGRFGGGVLIAVVAVYGLNQVYADLRDEIRQNRSVQIETITSITELTFAITHLSDKDKEG